ncbi:MAG: carbon-nitrogen hydrolase family protein [Pirellulales bacterium]|nr:carbon-nitrogen hydrolase family protein [Pirellulales bacterium]
MTAASSSTLRVGMGQMLVEPGCLRNNLRRAVRMIRDAAQQGCQVVVLPECLDLGWTHPSARQHAQPIPGPSAEALSQAASDAKIDVVAGLTERAGDRIYNAAVLVDGDGRLLARHRKINILEIAQDLYSVGDQLSVTKASWGTVGIAVCADNFPDSHCLGHALARMGAQIVLSPCAWAVPPDHDNRQEPYGELWKGSYATLARLYEMPMVGVSNVGLITEGPWQGRKCIGCSLAVGGQGEVVFQAPYGEDAECLGIVDLELTPRRYRGTAIAPMLRAKGYEAGIATDRGDADGPA